MSSAPRVIDGRYRLAEKIGHGGMGQVWAAYDERLDRRVAVKLLRTDRLLAATTGRVTGSHGEELRRRFLRECRITAALDHPGLVTVLDAGEERGELYLVMQRIPGLSLADLLAEQQPFPIEAAVAVAAQICAALAVVHAVPVVHRDLKPSNVMVRQDGRVVVLDLGIATALDADTTRLTMTGAPVGSPTYMAPEQVLSAVADPRSDLYALGCMLHEMLAGEAPFRAPTAIGLLHRHIGEAPPSVREFRPEVPEWLARLVLDLLAKRPDDRPAGVQQVYQRLLPLLPSSSGTPQPRFGGLPDPTAPYRYPHQPDPATGATPPPPPAPALPPQPAQAPPAPAPARPAQPSPAQPSPAQAQAASAQDLTVACAELADLVAARRNAEVIDLAARLLPRAEAGLGPAAPPVRTIRAIYARTLLQERQYRVALPEYHRLAAAEEAELGPQHPSVLDHRRNAALCLEHLGQTAEALAEYRQLLTRWGAHGPETDQLFELREKIGLLTAAAGDLEGAWQGLVQLLFDRERRLGPHHPEVRRLRQTLDQLNSHRTTTAPTRRPLPGNPYAVG
ncbi:serine/threonine protein kinase [Kitasatospora sp. MMS16-BH015]|uniref:serine/threonine-protein kinase n=1 Tax=Kitasatospora sp. MMS16-BH015 TaxID=2018025 RepID=UPI000CA18590|nr:serine/threonine-protein kinase [Kitasatospora sp. MMS16-BH015]AUG79380.1 serine/threonine protein kinase [Kitasatospora sp. MMS16-BH015]